MQFKFLFMLSAIALATLSTSIASAQSSSLCDRIIDPYQRFYCQGTAAQQEQVRSYSARQRYLAEAVSQLVYTYYQRTGEALPVTSQTVLEVMQILGASSSEAAFVADRIIANVQAIAVLFK